MNLPKLKSKDTVCIIAPAGSLTKEMISNTISLIEKKDLKVEIGKHVFSKYEFGYSFSANEKDRLEDLQWAFNHPTAKAIWCARGGYGGVHLIDQLDFSKFIKNPKWFIGYSDNTVFHQYFTKKGIPSIHGSTLKPLSSNLSNETFESVFKILKHESLQYEIPFFKYNKLGNTEGILTGGNLSIVYSLIGSNTIDNFKNRILFLEDWQENWYHLDRMLVCLDRAGIFKNLNGMIIGSFTKMDTEEENINFENTFDDLSYNIISNRLSNYKFPIAFGMPSGHINDNRALIMGDKINLNIQSKSTIIKFK